MTFVRPAALCAALAAFPAAAFAASPAATEADLKQLREQLRELRDNYQQRIDALERRLAEADTRSTAAATAAAEAGTTASAAARSVAEARTEAGGTVNRPAAESAFNPSVSLILDSKLTRFQRDPSSYRIDGFIPSGGEVGPPRKGFSLGESELAISANVDHLFRGNARFSLAEEDGAGVVNVEEASVETLALPEGFKMKFGRFLSGVGYLNQQHPHEWDFADAPLAYKAFFGYRVQNDGVQLRWVAPTDLFMEFGAEVANGGSFPGAERKANGAGLWTAFAHLGGDIGDSSAWQVGLSHVRANPRERAFDDQNATNAFSGSSQTWIADFVYKWAPNGNSSVTNLKLQGEYLLRRETGELSYDVGGAGKASSAARFRQSGSYLQAVYQFMPRWRVGVRGDWLRSGTADLGTLDPAGLPILAGYNPTRQSAMLDWSPSEFSRLRLQLARDKSRDGESDNQVWLQYVMSLGAHGAHKF